MGGWRPGVNSLAFLHLLQHCTPRQDQSRTDSRWLDSSMHRSSCGPRDAAAPGPALAGAELLRS